MKHCSFLIFVLLIFINCKSDVDSSEETKLNRDKFLVRANIDVETIDSLIDVNSNDFQRIKMMLFPSFNQSHYVEIDFVSNEIFIYQTTQENELYIDENYFRLPQKEKEDYLYQKMKLNKTKNINHKLSSKDINEIFIVLKHFKQSKYKSKMVEQLDGMTIFTEIYEKDTIVAINTNFPSSHQKKFMHTVFEISKKYANDSITKKNIDGLMQYL